MQHVIGLIVFTVMITAGGLPQVSIHDAASKGDLQAVKALLAQDPSLLEFEKPPNKKTPLHYAAQNGHADVVAFLLDKGAQINRPNVVGETPLHYAVGLGDPTVVRLLLARGADVRAKTTFGWTPLRQAVASGQFPAIEALLDKGADPRETTARGETLLHVWAPSRLSPRTIVLFAGLGVSVDAATDTGETPLLAACTVGNTETAAALLDLRADPNKPDRAGRQPLIQAVRTGKVDLVERLLAAGARPGQATTADKRTALHVAAAMGWLQIARMLLDSGADVNARDSQGRLALDLAESHGNRKVADAISHRQATTRRPPSVGPVARVANARAPGEAVVWYLGNSGWAVRTARHLLVFDYARRWPLPDDPSIANGVIAPADIKDLPVTVFISHAHADHYVPAVFDLKKTIPNISYVTGFTPEGQQGYIEAARNGVFYAIDRLSARRVFPMHGDGEEYWYTEFAAEAAKAGIRVPVTCVEFEGDHVSIQPGSPTRGR